MTEGYGSYGMFVVNYDPSGAFIWARGAGTGNYSIATDVAVDGSGNVIVAGHFYGGLQFGANSLVSAAAYPHVNAFLVKLTGRGDVLWTRAVDGTRSNSISGLAVAADGSILVTGTFHTRADFEGRSLTNSGHDEPFHAKYTASGTALWARAVTTSAGGRGSAMVVDNSGNSLVSGHLLGPGQAESTLLNEGFFLAKYTSAGSLIWARQPADATNYVFHSLATSDGNLVMAGEKIHPAQGVIVKVDSNGSQIWSQTSGNTVADVVADGAGNTFVTGSFYDSNSVSFTSLSPENWQAFVAAYGPDGSPLWTRNVCATNASNWGNGLALSTSGHLFLAGEFTAACRCDSTFIVGAGDRDGYIARLASAPGTLEPPLITGQPQDQTVVAGTDASFTILASGTPPLLYQWRWNGTNLLGESAPGLTIRNAQLSNAGAYSVVISNSVGAVTSTVATLRINYSLLVRADGNGTVLRQPNQTNFAPGASVALTALPTLAHGFIGWSGDADGAMNPIVFTMISNRTITAHFASTVVTISVLGDGVVFKSPDKPFYGVGEAVTLIATPQRYFEFAGWGDGVSANPRVITIGASNRFTATFAPVTALETLTFGDVSRTAPIGMPGIFIDDTFVVTGAVTRLDSAWLTIRTTFTNGAIFFTTDGTAPTFSSRLYTEPILLRRSAMLRAIAYDASFGSSWEADPVELIIEPTFAVNVVDSGGGGVAVVPSDAAYRSNTMVTLTAIPWNGWRFLQWLGDASGTNPTTSMRIVRPSCVQALFGVSLNTTVAGNGSLRMDPTAALYPYGAVVRLTAVPHTGNYFGAWGNAVVSTNNPLSFTVTNSDPTISSIFGMLSPAQAALTVVAEGHGHVTTSPRANRYNLNQAVRLTAVPGIDQDFLGWSGDGAGIETNLTLIMNESKMVTARFSSRPRVSVGPCLGGFSTEGFQLTLTGDPGRYEIEKSALLTPWIPLTSVINMFGTAQFTDRSALGSSNGLYRARMSSQP